MTEELIEYDAIGLAELIRAGKISPVELLDLTINFVAFTRIQNLTGQPAMSVPLFWNKDNLLINVQFAGRFGDEATLFRLATQLERARPWADRKPPIHCSYQL